MEEFARRCAKVDELFNELLSSDESGFKDVKYLNTLRSKIGLDEIDQRLSINECAMQLKEANTIDSLERKRKKNEIEHEYTYVEVKPGKRKFRN